MDNPYAPPLPVAGAEDLSKRGSHYLNLPWSFAAMGGLGASVLSGICVLVYQVLRYWLNWPRTHAVNWFIVLESASFSSAALFTALVFTTPWRKDHARNLGFALLFGVIGLALYMTGIYLIQYSRQFAMVLLLIFFPASQMLMVATICWIHRVSVRLVRLLMGGLLGLGVWLALTAGAIALLVSSLPHPYDDYAGYTLLTMFWCWTVAAQMPLMLNKQLRERAEQ